MLPPERSNSACRCETERRELAPRETVEGRAAAIVRAPHDVQPLDATAATAAAAAAAPAVERGVLWAGRWLRKCGWPVVNFALAMMPRCGNEALGIPPPLPTTLPPDADSRTRVETRNTDPNDPNMASPISLSVREEAVQIVEELEEEVRLLSDQVDHWKQKEADARQEEAACLEAFLSVPTPRRPATSLEPSLMLEEAGPTSEAKQEQRTLADVSPGSSSSAGAHGLIFGRWRAENESESDRDLDAQSTHGYQESALHELGLSSGVETVQAEIHKEMDALASQALSGVWDAQGHAQAETHSVVPVKESILLQIDDDGNVTGGVAETQSAEIDRSVVVVRSNSTS